MFKQSIKQKKLLECGARQQVARNMLAFNQHSNYVLIVFCAFELRLVRFLRKPPLLMGSSKIWGWGCRFFEIPSMATLAKAEKLGFRAISPF